MPFAVFIIDSVSFYVYHFQFVSVTDLLEIDISAGFPRCLPSQFSKNLFNICLHFQRSIATSLLDSKMSGAIVTAICTMTGGSLGVVAASIVATELEVVPLKMSTITGAGGLVGGVIGYKMARHPELYIQDLNRTAVLK